MAYMWHYIAADRPFVSSWMQLRDALQPGQQESGLFYAVGHEPKEPTG